MQEYAGKLVDVFYEMFPSDAEWLDENTDSEYHILDREIRLQMADGKDLFISWVELLEPGDFAVGIAHQTHNKNPPEVVRSMAAHPIWRNVIGQSVMLSYSDASRQILRLTTKEYTVYVCTYDAIKGYWEADALYISHRLPSVPHRAR